MTISFDRLDFLQRENQLRQEDVRRLRSSVQRKIALLKSQFSQTQKRHEHFKSTFLEDRFSMAPKKFFDSLSAIRQHQHGEQRLQKSLDVITKHSHRLERQLAYYEKKQELVAKKQAEHRAVERAIKEECESEQIQSLAFLLRRAIQAPYGLDCPQEEIGDSCTVVPERSSTEESDDVTLDKKVSAERAEREEDVVGTLSESEVVSQDEVQYVVDTESNTSHIRDEGTGDALASLWFQGSLHQKQHEQYHPEQNPEYMSDRSGEQQSLNDGSLQKAQHWKDRDGHHHLVFQVPLSRNESVRIAVERQRENHLSLVLIADRRQRVSLEQVRVQLYNRLEGAGFLLDGLRIIREG